jgi:hypothetical protein
MTPLLMADSQVLMRFQVRGSQHEEFMGAGTGVHLEFRAQILFRLCDGLIDESWMYKKSLRMTSKKGEVFEWMPRAEPASDRSKSSGFLRCSC